MSVIPAFQSRWPLAMLATLAAACLVPVVVAAQAPSGTAPGQNANVTAPKLPAPAPAPIVSAPPVSGGAAASQDQTVLVPVLRGLVFVAGSKALVSAGLAETAAGPTGVGAPDLPLLRDAAFTETMRAFVGKPLTVADLQKIRDQTKAWYTRHKRPFIDVVAPPQNITSGVVQIVVSEYVLGDVEVIGNRHFSTKLVLAPFDLKPGQTIALDQLQDNIDRLNENPFLSVNAEFKPGQQPGATDLTLRATDRLPVRVYAGYDNQGVPTLDRDEWNAGVNWGNAFGTGQIVSYQFTRAFNGRFTSHSASDVIRVDNDDKILLFGNYATMRSEAELLSFLGPLDFDTNGHASQASVRFVHTLPKLFGGALTGHIQIGYDYKATDNNSFFDEIQLGPPSLMDTSQFPLVYDGQEVDRFGSTAIENDLVYAPSRITPNDTDADFQLLVAGARARYLYDRLSITRTNRLPLDFSVVGRLIVQRSNQILPNSEQLGGGGVGSARGYDPDTGLGSNGELASLELRAPAFSPTQQVGWKGLNDLAQFGLFYDYVSLSQPKLPVDILTGGIASSALPLDLASTGAFVHYSIGRYIDLNFDMGFQLRHAPNQTQLGNYGAIAIVFSN